MGKDANTIVVLLVEDQTGMRKIIKTILQAIGVKTIFEAGDGAEALSILSDPSQRRKKGHPDIIRSIDFIICDWAMPKMTGIELLEIVRKDLRYAGLPFFMLTAENDREKIVRAIELGVTDYIVKPFKAGILEAKLRSVLAEL